ncbi:caspase activity and apoptosis inhibitor 1 [Rhinichthys klamathensis goyatoka]|uniref:caspase activity and apoptosis inhibitor 1 n=1 Tax=Rhinichthys klamathensis goyatoka TaxID=3034132 RepID=UPI0024B48AFA|nr:caspase activity and apoptosis inhibitor 1 [Rhinichthys klamathensis goyatoka]
MRRRSSSNGKMQEGKKREKEKKRGHSDREHNEVELKRRNIESSTVEPRKEKEEPEVPRDPSDLEEGGLDLNKAFKPISAYMQDRKEMLEQCFHVLGENKLKKMLPDELKDCSFNEIKKLCWDQLQELSEIHLLEILEGKELSVTAAPEGNNLTDSQQDSNVDSTSSLKENPEMEEKQGAGSGEDSDVLSINAEIDDSDIEGHKVIKAEESVIRDETLPPAPVMQSAEPKVELQQDIDRSVSEILALTSSEPSKDLRTESLDKSATIENALAAPTEQPSAQQLELLELEMRARAIKALMKASEIKKHNNC